MSTPSEQTLTDIATAVSAGRPMDAEMVKRVRQILFGEERLVARMLSPEPIDRAEADLLFRIHRSLAHDRRDPSWHQLFAEAITSHVLKDETSPGILDDAEANYLLSRIHRDDDVDEGELELLVSVISAVRHAPKRFQTFVLAAVAEAVLADGIIDDDDVRLVRRVIHGAGSGGGRHVDEREHQLLSGINARSAGLPRSSLWHAMLFEAGLEPEQ